jgi:integrase
MSRPPKPWFRKDRQEWYVTLSGKRVRLGPDKEEAFRKFHALKARQIKLREECFVVLMNDLLEWTKKNRRAGTYRFYQEHAQQFLDWLKDEKKVDIECDQLTPDLVESYLEQCSVGRRNGAVQLLKRVYNWGIKRGRIKSNPIMAVEKPAQGRRKNYVTSATFKKMIKNSDELFSDLLTFCWNTGCRPQEAWKIKTAYIQEEFNRCVIPKSETKRNKGDRVIYCNAAAWAIVVKLSGNSDFLFVNRNGKSWNKDNVSSRMEVLAKKLDKRYALYDIRHTWITNRVKEGMDIHMIAKLAGTSIAMIERFYDQSDQDALFMLSAVQEAGV